MPADLTFDDPDLLIKPRHDEVRAHALHELAWPIVDDRFGRERAGVLGS